MKIISINESPTLEDDDGAIRADLKDIGKIISRIDSCEGRNDALIAYVYALRDLQRAHDLNCVCSADCSPEIEKAQAKVEREFDRLIIAQFTLNAPCK
jgi:hypothetical protein